MKAHFAKVKAFVERYEKPALILIGAVSLTVVLLNLEFNLFEAKLYDFRMTYGAQPAPDSRIVLVTLDDRTTKSLNDFAPLPLDVHARFVEQLERYEPQSVGYLVDMNYVNQINPELFEQEYGQRFVDAAKRIQAKGTPFVMGTRFDISGEVLPPYPLSSLDHGLAIIHKDGNIFAEDSVTRRAITTLYGKSTFHVMLARQSAEADTQIETPLRGSYFVPEVDGEFTLIRYHGDTQVFGDGGGLSSSYPIVSFADVLNGNVRREALEGKIILVGTLNRENPSDFSLTPYSRASFSNPKIVIHANILDTVLHNAGVARAPEWMNLILTFLATMAVLWWVMNSTPLYGVFATLGLVSAVLALGLVSFDGLGTFHGIWLPMAQPLVGVFVGYYLVVPYRLIREYKKRWAYQRRNEILVQVEELKTNFLSLITHDLKTPVARIQGLAEVLLNKASQRLDARDKDTLHNVIASTEELNRFISSILELTKLESRQIRLNLESKDVNQLIERLLVGFKAQSRARNVSIHSHLEPLFPIKIDPSLMSKVINNLIDNALKYSPEGSEVHVSTQEVDDYIEICVKDQGIGMSTEEQKKLFTKFYRAKNDTTTKVTGTGLGLYLTKFFVEAHKGRVEVESQPGAGSAFKIFLPLDIDQAQSTHVRPGLALGRLIPKKERKHV